MAERTEAARDVVREYMAKVISGATYAGEMGLAPPSAEVAADGLLAALQDVGGWRLNAAVRKAYIERKQFIAESGGAAGGTWGSDAEFEEELQRASRESVCADCGGFGRDGDAEMTTCVKCGGSGYAPRAGESGHQQAAGMYDAFVGVLRDRPCNSAFHWTIGAEGPCPTCGRTVNGVVPR